MKYRVLLETQARKEFLVLPRDIRARLAEAIDNLVEYPRPSGVKKLVGVQGYRLRKGDYRILFTIEEAAKEIKIFRIGHRREIYR